jgi:hypothetical protein
MNDNQKDNAIVCGQLALERCNQYVSHIHAVLFMCKEDKKPLDEIATDSVQQLVTLLGMELRKGYELISRSHAH